MVAHNQPSFVSLLESAQGQAEAVRHDPVDRILNAVRQHLGMEVAFVSRYVEDGMKELTHVDSDLDLPMGPGFRDPREDSYCWHIAEGRLPELIQDPVDHPFTATMGITDFLPVGAHLNTPLRLSDGTLYGSFCCLSRSPDRTMTERDLGILRAFAVLAIGQIEAALEDDGKFAAARARIDGVLRSRDLTIVQQPIHSLASGLPVGAECLARFPAAAERGPETWFHEAASIGRGIELEMLAVDLALATAATLPADCYVSINASPDTVLSGELEAALQARGAANIVVELTEHQAVEDFGALKAALARVARHARIAIDDVGAGYAGLRHLVELSPDLLKLDISLVRDVHKDVARRALVSAMVRFGAAIGSKLVAEGIECAEEAATLADLGVDYGQGYYFARPMPVTDAARHFARAA